MTTPFEPPQAPAAEAAPTRLFPTLSAAQIARIAAHGRRRPISRGELLVDVGDAAVPLFVVVSGEVQVLRVQDERETLVVNYHAGHFSGEASTIAGRRALVRLRVTEPGEVIEVDRDHFLRLVQIDSELSEILMRTLLLRRVELVAHGFGDVVVIGSTHCAGTLRGSRRPRLAAGALTVPAGDQPSLHLRGRRRPQRQHETGRVRRREGSTAIELMHQPLRE